MNNALKKYSVEVFIMAECPSDAIERIEDIDVDEELEGIGDIREFKEA